MLEGRQTCSVIEYDIISNISFVCSDSLCNLKCPSFGLWTRRKEDRRREREREREREEGRERERERERGREGLINFKMIIKVSESTTLDVLKPIVLQYDNV